MSGFLKQNDYYKLPFNTSKNIEHKGIKLYDYLDILKKNIINLFSIHHVGKMGIALNSQSLQATGAYEVYSLNYQYCRFNGTQDFTADSNSITINSSYKKNLLIHLNSSVRCDSYVDGHKYIKICQYRDGSLVEEHFVNTYVLSNQIGTMGLSLFLKVTKNDKITINIYGATGDTFLYTRAIFELSKQDDINYYNWL